MHCPKCLAAHVIVCAVDDNSGLDLSTGDGSFQAYGAQIVPADKPKLVPGVAYTIQPSNTGDTDRWAVAPNVTPLTLKE
jgi:hypothetical protein